MPAALTDEIAAERVGVLGKFTVADILAARPAPIAPDQYAETDTHFYFGWQSINGGWLVRRQDRSTGAIVNASTANNSGVADLSTAWADRLNLTYL